MQRRSGRWVAALVVLMQLDCSDDGPSAGPAARADAGDAAAGELPVITGPRTPACDDATFLPTDLRCTGLYSDFASKTISPEAREFTPAISLWSDGARKRRWLYLPPNTQIDTSDMDEWIFPVGTKVWKEFRVAGKAVETRLFAKKDPSSWVFTTYVWDDTESNAYRLDTGRAHAVGDYEIPSKIHCSQCHNGHADRLLGVEAVLMALPNAGGVTLTTLKAEGRLSAPPAKTTLSLPGNEQAQRALGWLHANCGIVCHSPNASATSSFTGLLLRLSAKSLLSGPGNVTDTDAYKTAVNKPFVSALYLDDPRYLGYKRITPGAPDKSVIVAAISSKGADRMPPIVSHEVDEEGVRLLREWVTSLP